MYNPPENKALSDINKVCYFILLLSLNTVTGLSKVAGCWQKSPPTWLVLAGHSVWHFFTDGVFFYKISLDWLPILTTQPSTSNLSDPKSLGTLIAN